MVAGFGLSPCFFAQNPKPGSKVLNEVAEVVSSRDFLFDVGDPLGASSIPEGLTPVEMNVSQAFQSPFNVRAKQAQRFCYYHSLALQTCHLNSEQALTRRSHEVSTTKR